MSSNNLGMDPEFFIKDRKTGLAMSAHKFIGDRTITNEKYPSKAHETRPTAEVDRDGAAMEVRTTLVSPCRDYLVPYLGQALQYAHNELVEKYGPDAYEFGSAPIFRLNDLRGPADIREFGCSPDFNGYTLEEQNPALAKGDRRRMTGGHIHVSGYKTNDLAINEHAALAVLFDAIIGLPMVAMLGEAFADGEAERRETYGKAGSYRYDARLGKLEYRVLSGRFILHPIITTWALGVARATVPSNFVVNAKSYLEIVQGLAAVVDLNEVRNIIDSHDVAGAENLYPAIYDHLNRRWLKEPKASIDSMRISLGGYGLMPFRPVIDVIVEANHHGVHFEDDMLYNWQLYKGHKIKDHQFVGVHNAMAGMYSDDIFPQRAFLTNHIAQGYSTYEYPIKAHYMQKAADKKNLQKARGW